MKHFGIITPPVAGHVNPFSAIGRELTRRGHRVTVFHMADLESKIRAEGLDFVTIGQTDHPPGTLRATLETIGSLSGVRATRYTIGAAARSTEMFFRDAPQQFRKHQVDALLVDQTEPAGASIADYLQLPYVTICNALALNRENSVPPPFSDFPFSRSSFARLRNRAGYAIGRRATRPVTRITNTYRSRWGLTPYRDPDESFSKLAQLSQQPPAFDFPRSSLPPCFHYLGPFRDEKASASEFPWERITGTDVAYVSLGSMQGSKLDLFRMFATACADLGLQAVISHGGSLSAIEVATLPGSHLVVSYAPQYEVIRRSRITLTHAGLNTALDSLTHGTPLVAVPITYEQPAIAQRITWSGVGITIPLESITVSRVRSAVDEVLHSSAYKSAATAVQESIRQAGGTRRAADIIERVV